MNYGLHPGVGVFYDLEILDGEGKDRREVVELGGDLVEHC